MDSRKNSKQFPFTRFTYFTIEAVEPSLGWRLNTPEEVSVPFIMLGLSGIIYRPANSNEGDRFTTPDQIEQLFETIEERKELIVGIDDIFIPNEDLDKLDLPRQRGAVIRCALPYFRAALALPDDGFNLESLQAKLYSYKTPGVKTFLEYSNRETSVFLQWVKLQIENAIKTYPKNENMKLDYGEGKQRRPDQGYDGPDIPKGPDLGPSGPTMGR